VDDELNAMTQLAKGMAGLMQDAIDAGMDKEAALHVVGDVALTCMKKAPKTDDAQAVVQNFVMKVGELMGEPRTTIRH
jgi:hypothetical protein